MPVAKFAKCYAQKGSLQTLLNSSQLPIEVTIASASCQAVSAGSFLTFLPLTPPYSFCKLAASLWRTLPRMSGPSEPSLGGISTTPWPLRFLALHQLFISRFHQHPRAPSSSGPPRCDHHIAVTFCPPRCSHVFLRPTSAPREDHRHLDSHASPLR